MSHDVVVVDHPLVQHKLSQMRARETPSGDFRRLLKETSMLLGYEATRDLPVVEREIETPLERMRAPMLENEEVVLVSVLRAGNGILDGMLEILPSARVGYIGLYRDPETLEAVQYYVNLPQDMAGHGAIVLDPMLATGHSAHEAIVGGQASRAVVDPLRRAGLGAGGHRVRALAPSRRHHLHRRHRPRAQRSRLHHARARRRRRSPVRDQASRSEASSGARRLRTPARKCRWRHGRRISGAAG